MSKKETQYFSLERFEELYNNELAKSLKKEREIEDSDDNHTPRTLKDISESLAMKSGARDCILDNIYFSIDGKTIFVQHENKLSEYDYISFENYAGRTIKEFNKSILKKIVTRYTADVFNEDFIVDKVGHRINLATKEQKILINEQALKIKELENLLVELQNVEPKKDKVDKDKPKKEKADREKPKKESPKKDKVDFFENMVDEDIVTATTDEEFNKLMNDLPMFEKIVKAKNSKKNKQ